MIKKKNKILISLKYFYPGYKSGGPVKSVESLIQNLEKKFEISVLCLNQDIDGKKYKNLTENNFFKNTKCKIFYINNYFLNYFQIYNTLKNIKPNILYTNSFFDFKFSFIIICITKILLPSTKIIICPRGEFNNSALTFKSFKKKVFLKFINFFKIYSKVNFQATNYLEKDQIKKYLLIKDKNIFVIRNLYNNNYTYMNSLKKNNFIRIVSLARINKIKNIIFAIKIVKKLKINFKFDIWGVIEDKKYYKECINEIGNEFKNKISIKGFLDPIFLEKKMLEYDVFFLPSLGENFSHAIMESLRFGIPIIISQETPFKNLETKGVGFDISLKNHNNFLDKLIFFQRMSDRDIKNYKKNCINYAKELSNQDNSLMQYNEMFQSD